MCALICDMCMNTFINFIGWDPPYVDGSKSSSSQSRHTHTLISSFFPFSFSFFFLLFFGSELSFSSQGVLFQFFFILEALRAKSLKILNMKVVNRDKGYTWLPSELRLEEVDFCGVCPNPLLARFGLGSLQISVRAF